MKNKRKAFTLVELLATIVILSIILVIALPKVINIINDSKKATLESTAKMVASAAEKTKLQNQVLGKEEKLTCENVSKLNNVDYERCNLEFDGNTALVTIKGKNKFEGLYICKGTKNDSKVVDYCPNEKVLVEIDPAGGTVEDLSGIYKEGDKLELLIPTKENNTFLSWNVVKGNSTIEENILTVGSADTIVYALYEAWNKLEVDLNEGIDNVEYEEYYKSGTTIELTEPTRENYKFVGWQLIEGNSVLSGSTLTMGSENTKVKAIWELNVFNLSVNLNGGSISKDISGDYTVGSNIALEIPTKTGYTFAGWTASSGNVSGNTFTIGNGDAVLIANWILNTNTAYKVRHYQMNLDGSTYTLKETENKTGTTAASVTPSVKTYTGFTSPSTQTKTILADGSMVIDYYYTRNKYYLDLNGLLDGSATGNISGYGTADVYVNGTKVGTGVTDYYQQNYYGSTYEIKNIKVSTGKTYNGVSSGSASGTIGDFVTVQLKFTTNTYTISYTLNGGSKGSSAPTSGTYGSTVTVSNPTRANYSFTGWSVSGTGASISGTTLTIGAGNITLTANWKIANMIPSFTYTGSYKIVNDSDTVITTSTGNWKIRFLTSGTLKFTDLRGAANGIDVFLVGGGGGGGPTNSGWSAGESNIQVGGGGGGGGGYATTKKGVSVSQNVAYTITVGSGGAASSSGGTTSITNLSVGTISASGGGAGGSYAGGGAGGSGGNAGGKGAHPGDYLAGVKGKSGATATKEFGSGKAYAGGGGGGSGENNGRYFDYGAGGDGGGGAGGNNEVGSPGTTNTGGGGGGGGVNSTNSFKVNSGGKGGSGIVIIRNKR